MSKDATWAKTIGCHFDPPLLKEIVLQHIRIVATFGTVPSNQNKALGVGAIRECVTSKAWQFLKLLPVVRAPRWIDVRLQHSPLQLHQVQPPEVGEVEMAVCPADDVHAVCQRGEGGRVKESGAWLLLLGLVGGERDGAEREVGRVEDTQVLESRLVSVQAAKDPDPACGVHNHCVAHSRKRILWHISQFPVLLDYVRVWQDLGGAGGSSESWRTVKPTKTGVTESLGTVVGADLGILACFATNLK